MRKTRTFNEPLSSMKISSFLEDLVKEKLLKPNQTVFFKRYYVYNENLTIVYLYSKPYIISYGSSVLFYKGNRRLNLEEFLESLKSFKLKEKFLYNLDLFQ